MEHRIKTKIGAHEFEAAGDKDSVNAHYEKWLAAITAMPVAAPAAPAAPATPASESAASTAGGGVVPQAGVSRDLFDRVFRQDDGISLAALPTTENVQQDALISLLYGIWKTSGESQVTGTALMKAARTSGINVDRIDRVINAYIPAYVTAGGVKKGRRYQLNNPGIAKAEEVIRTMMK